MISIYTFCTTNCLVFLILFCCVWCDLKVNEEEWLFLTKPHNYNSNLIKVLSNYPITGSVTSIYDDISNIKVDKVYTSDPYLYEQVNSEQFKIDNTESSAFIYDVTKGLMLKDEEYKNEDGIYCLWCFTDRGYMSDEACYSGTTQTKLKCSSDEICYTELHPQYIKRGCLMPKKTNRTFVCNCPLCNDKSVYDSIYYKYNKISDWDYHNKRIQIPIVGMQLMCKACDTRNLGTISNDNCKFGRNDDYLVCGRKQVCFVNYDQERESVSRGCIDTPIYNSMYYYCNSSLCNSNAFYIPKIRSEKLLLNNLSPKPQQTDTYSSAEVIGYQNVFRILLFGQTVFALVKLNLS